MTGTIASRDITLGVLAGGRATRLGGLDKAWLERGGVPQVLRWQRRFAHEVAAMLVSANRDLPRYAEVHLPAVADRVSGDVGPLAGLESLLAHCTTPWLLTLPVDLVGVNECLLPTLVSASGETGAFAQDEEGEQPLVALWRTETARPAVARALASGHHAIRSLQEALSMHPVRFTGVRFGNLNTRDDLRAAGMALS